MIATAAPLTAAWLPLSALSVEQYERRDLDRVAFYARLLIAHPAEHCGPPVVVVPRGEGRYAILDGHHRYVAHILAGRDTVPCVIVGAPPLKAIEGL